MIWYSVQVSPRTSVGRVPKPDHALAVPGAAGSHRCSDSRRVLASSADSWTVALTVSGRPQSLRSPVIDATADRRRLSARDRGDLARASTGPGTTTSRSTSTSSAAACRRCRHRRPGRRRSWRPATALAAMRRASSVTSRRDAIRPGLEDEFQVLAGGRDGTRRDAVAARRGRHAQPVTQRESLVSGVPRRRSVRGPRGPAAW